MDTILSTIEDGAGRMVEQTVDHGDGTGTRTIYHDDGTQTVDQIDGLPVPVPSPPSTAIAAARQAVSTLSPTAATRRAVEALATAVEAMTPIP
jgi:hypothetical protein